MLRIRRIKRNCLSQTWATRCSGCVKKAISIGGEKRLTETIDTEVSAKVEASNVTGRHVSISGIRNSFGVFHSGYRAFLNRKISPARQRKAAIKKPIQRIYDDSNQNYGAPKITKELHKSGECISQRTIGKYMREMSG